MSLKYRYFMLLVITYLVTLLHFIFIQTVTSHKSLFISTKDLVTYFIDFERLMEDLTKQKLNHKT